MAENKTQPTSQDLAPVIAAIEADDRRRDVEALDALMRRVPAAEPVMWGPAMFGYGSYDYTYVSRSQDLVIYVMSGFKALYFKALYKELARLGPQRTAQELPLSQDARRHKHWGSRTHSGALALSHG